MGMPTALVPGVSMASRLLGYEPQYDYRRMVDAALASARGEDIRVIA
jgi:hypothetical protein